MFFVVCLFNFLVVGLVVVVVAAAVVVLLDESIKNPSVHPHAQPPLLPCQPSLHPLSHPPLSGSLPKPVE